MMLGGAAFNSVGGCWISQSAWASRSPVVVQKTRASRAIRLSGLPSSNHLLAISQLNCDAAERVPQLVETLIIRWPIFSIHSNVCRHSKYSSAALLSVKLLVFDASIASVTNSNPCRIDQPG